MSSSRIDTRRFRRINPLGPNPDHQAKLLGSRTSYMKVFCGNFKSRAELLMEAVGDTEDSDMTPIPRRDGDISAKRKGRFRLYPRGCMVTAEEIVKY
ncbi:MAG: hypothetical protein Q7K16_04720 [Candidatus Azambacteria bacterium]|nr:hypothetical protein [Candidatus Azambacteria bacterium]